MTNKDLSSLERDVLKEIGNIGAGNATTSLSTLIDHRIRMEVPSVHLVTFDEMMHLIGGSEQIVAGLFFRIEGEAPGTVSFMLPIKEAESLIKKIMPDTHVYLLSDDGTNEYALSALREVGNIITGSYLSALSDFMSLEMSYSIPYLSVDMAGAILTTGLVEISQETDTAILINTKLNDEENNLFQGQFIFVPDPGTFPTFLSSLGIQYDDA